MRDVRATLFSALTGAVALALAGCDRPLANQLGASRLGSAERRAISADRAVEIALNAEAGQVVGLELEEGSWSVEVADERRVVEVVLDAGSGRVLLREGDDDEPVALPVVAAAEALRAAGRQLGAEVVELELELDGLPRWEAEGADGREALVDATTGGLMAAPRDDDADEDERSRTAQVRPERAAQAARSEVGGVVTEVELDDGELAYEVELRAGEEEVEVEVDAASAVVLSVEVERD